jgi:hypothetical protein
VVCRPTELMVDFTEGKKEIKKTQMKSSSGETPVTDHTYARLQFVE